MIFNGFLVKNLQVGLGNSAGGNLAIKFTEYRGADFNPGFNDTDSTPILYRLFSYYQLSGLNSSTNALQMKISAHNLIVDHPKDIRLVGTGYAAPGDHVESLDTVNLWAIRNLTFEDLLDKNFTVGSTRYPSILPIIWLELECKWNEDVVKIFWTSTENDLAAKYEIFRFLSLKDDLELAGEVNVSANSESIQSFSFTDQTAKNYSKGLYQIKKVNQNGSYFWSEIFRVEGEAKVAKHHFSIYPNPSVNSEQVRVSFGKNVKADLIEVQIVDPSGRLKAKFEYSQNEFEVRLAELPAGVYLIRFLSKDMTTTLRWIKL